MESLIDCNQGGEQWHKLRIGHIGSSMLNLVMAEGKTKGTMSSTREDYMVTLLTERLTGKWDEGFYSNWMERGKELEPLARSAYEARMEVMVIENIGREHKEIPDWWCSPDGLVSNDGMMEIKCLKPKNHLKTILKGYIDRKYILQMTGGVSVYERDWIDYVSYCPTFPENLQLFVKRFYRKDLPIDEVRDGVVQFIKELDALEASLRLLGGK